VADFFDQLTDKQIKFIGVQPMFFIATAPKSGRINLSPKGMDCFRVLSPNLVAYLDVTGSGNETAAHIKDDGRVTVMFNSFEQFPLILRLYGTGRVASIGSPEWEQYIHLFTELPGARQIILIDVESIQTSCGYAVPIMEFRQERPVLKDWAIKKDDDELAAYQQENNTVSIDGLATGFKAPK